jgi:hypothetical protein
VTVVVECPFADSHPLLVSLKHVDGGSPPVLLGTNYLLGLEYLPGDRSAEVGFGDILCNFVFAVLALIFALVTVTHGLDNCVFLSHHVECELNGFKLVDFSLFLFLFESGCAACSPHS